MCRAGLSAGTAASRGIPSPSNAGRMLRARLVHGPWRLRAQGRGQLLPAGNAAPAHTPSFSSHPGKCLRLRSLSAVLGHLTLLPTLLSSPSLSSPEPLLAPAGPAKLSPTTPPVFYQCSEFHKVLRLPHPVFFHCSSTTNRILKVLRRPQKRRRALACVSYCEKH